MKIVKSTSAVWWAGGVASTDAAALVGCGWASDDNPLVTFGRKLWMREKQMRKEAELEQGSPEWHKKRLTGIGGTEAAALVGASFRNQLRPDRIWDEKTGAVAVENLENENMKRGKRLEPVARELYEDLYGWSVAPMNVLHDDYDFVRASLDGLRSDDKLIVEIKSCQQTNHLKILKLQETEDPLERQQLLDYYFSYYHKQILYQLLITGAEVCHFVGYNEDFNDHRKIAVAEIYPEPRNQELLLRRVVEFWKFVEDRVPPPAEWCAYKLPSPTEIKLPSSNVPTISV